MGVAARTVVKIIVKTPATTVGGGATASKRQRGGGTAWIDQGAPGPLRRALGAKALVGTSGTNVTESSVTSGGGIPGSATSVGGDPGSVTLVTDLLRNPGGKKEW